MNTETNTELDDSVIADEDPIQLEQEGTPTEHVDETPDNLTDEPVDAEKELLRARADKLLSEKKSLSRRAADMAAELEAAQAELEAVKQEREELKDFHIRGPAVKLAKEMSPLPDVFMAEFSRFYKLDIEGDDIVILTLDGEPFRHNADSTLIKGEKRTYTKRDGDPVKFEVFDLYRALTGLRDEDQAKRFKAMMNYFGPKGTGARGSQRSYGASSTAAPKSTPDAPKLGLK